MATTVPMLSNHHSLKTWDENVFSIHEHVEVYGRLYAFSYDSQFKWYWSQSDCCNSFELFRRLHANFVWMWQVPVHKSHINILVYRKYIAQLLFNTILVQSTVHLQFMWVCTYSFNVLFIKKLTRAWIDLAFHRLRRWSQRRTILAAKLWGGIGTLTRPQWLSTPTCHCTLCPVTPWRVSAINCNNKDNDIDQGTLPASIHVPNKAGRSTFWNMFTRLWPSRSTQGPVFCWPNYMICFNIHLVARVEQLSPPICI